jgi:hypothetical protein
VSCLTNNINEPLLPREPTPSLSDDKVDNKDNSDTTSSEKVVQKMIL